MLVEDPRVGDVTVLVGEPFDGPVERDHVREAEIDADATAVPLHRRAGVMQPCGPVEQP